MLRHHGTSRLCWTIRYPPALAFGECWVSRNGGNCVFWVKCRNWLRTSKANSFGGKCCPAEPVWWVGQGKYLHLHRDKIPLGI